MRCWVDRSWALLVGLALGVVVAGCAEEPLTVPPMPPDLRVVPPSPSVPPENARFSGRWVGKWDEQLDHVLVVELQVQNGAATEVIAVYSWGAGSLGVGFPGWSRVRGRIEGGVLRLELHAGPGYGRLHHAGRRHAGGRILAR